MRQRFAVAGCLALAAPAIASAQISDTPRVYVSVNGGIQRSGNRVAQSFSIQKNFEDMPITADVDEKRGMLFDGGFVVRLFGPIGAGVDVSFMTHDADAAVTASVPHPFFFRQPRNISGATKTTRREIAGHIRGVYLIPGRRLDVMIFGGPSLFSVRQTLVTDVTYSETYPFDTATFTAAQTTNATAKLATGFHVGLDVGWKLSDNVGIGGMAQFARAKATLTAANNAPLKVDAGGLLAGAGIRLAF